MPRLCTTSPHLGVRQGRNKDHGRIRIHIASHNVRTLSTDSLLDIYLQQIEKIKADIVGVCETRRARAVSAKWSSGEEILLGEGADNVSRTGGVGFIVKAKMAPYVISCDIQSPRVAVLKIKLQKLGDRTLKIVQVYAPTASAEDDELERFYEEIERALKVKSTYTIVQGDFNAVVGSRLDGTEHLLGRYGVGVRNERGNRLVEFAEQHKFSIMNTFFEKKAKRLWTWRSPDTKTSRQIDYVLTDTPRLFADVSVIGESVIATGSDHRLLRSVILCDVRKENRVLHSQRTLIRRTFNADMYATMIASSDLQMKSGNGIDADYEDLVEKIMQAVKASSTATEPARRRRITPEAVQMMKKRARMKAEGRVQTADYRELCEAIRKKIKCDYEGYRQKKLREAAERRVSLKAVERDICLRHHIPSALKDDTGLRTTNRLRMNEICTKFFNDLYSSKAVVARAVQNTAEEPIPDVMWEEVEHAVKQIKAGKSPGCDNIRPEHLKAGGLPLFKALAQRFSRYCREKRIPAAWKKSRTILLMKKGDPESLDNYRPITLLSQVYKAFTRIILNRIVGDLDMAMSREQAGFRSGYSTLDHLHVVRQLTEKCGEYRIPLCIAFVDYRKAFDSVETNAMLNAMSRYGVNSCYVDLLEELNKGCTTKIKLFNDPCQIKICKGVRQGDTISPKLFALTLEALFTDLDWTGGIEIDGENLTYLLFADDCVVFAHDASELQAKLVQLQTKSSEIGLEMNLSKTKWMHNQFSPTATVKIDGETIEEVKSFKYLGHQLSFTEGSSGEYSRRRKAAWSSFNKISTLLLDEDLPMKLKASLFHSTVIPAVLYGAEC
ncbi:hypothetical protein V3C99_012831, partial [Haemonchus contortus]